MYGWSLPHENDLRAPFATREAAIRDARQEAATAEAAGHRITAVFIHEVRQPAPPDYIPDPDDIYDLFCENYEQLAPTCATEDAGILPRAGYSDALKAVLDAWVKGYLRGSGWVSISRERLNLGA